MLTQLELQDVAEDHTIVPDGYNIGASPPACRPIYPVVLRLISYN